MAVTNVGPPSNVSTAGVEVRYKDGRTVRYWALSERDRSKELKEFTSRSKKKDSDIVSVKKCDRKKTI
jgi:hypothetical protein